MTSFIPYSRAFWSMPLYTKLPLFGDGSSGLVYSGMLQTIRGLELAPLSETENIGFPRVSSMMVRQRMKRTWSCWRLKNIESLLLENRTFLFSTHGFHSNFEFWKIERFQFRTWFLFEFWVSLLVACHYVRNTTISFDLFFWRLWTLRMEHATNSRLRT